MENIRFRSVIDYKGYFKNSKFIGKGTEGKCYRIDDKSYKLYISSLRDIYDNDTMRKRLVRFRDLYVENFYFIRGLIFLKGHLFGSISDYAIGNDCEKAKLYRKSLDMIIKYLAILKENVLELSKCGIYINDSFLKNIVYGKNGFSFIDTGSYILYSDLPQLSDDVDTIYKENMKRVVRHLFKGITGYNQEHDNFIFSFLWHIDSEYKSYLVDTDMLLNPDATIIGIRNVLENAIGREIDSFSNCRNDLSRIRKNNAQ